MVYSSLGGHVGFDGVQINFLAFAALVAVFFTINHGTVSLAVSLTTDVSLREAWRGIAGGVLPYDMISSSLAIVLAYLFIKFQIVGLTVLVLPLFFVRHMYRMNLQLERANRELLELMVKAIEARDPYTSGHSIRVCEYARSMARELAGLGIRVNVVAPGIVMAGMARHQYETDPDYARRASVVIPLGEFGTAEQIAKATAFLCSPDAEYMTGSVLLVDGGASLFRFAE